MMLKKQTEKKSVLALFMICVGVVNSLAAFATALLRRKEAEDALLVWKGQIMLSAAGTIITLILFLYFLLRLKKQGYGHGAEVPLLYLWGVILIGAQTVYDITVVLYDSFIDNLIYFLPAEIYVSLYNDTHGFKYLGMFIAMILGILFTAILLKDRLLVMVGSIISVLFMLSFMFFRMWTVAVGPLNNNIWIVWTSVIFHLLQTVGMVILGWYISVKWKWQEIHVTEEEEKKAERSSSLICPILNMEKDRQKALVEAERFANEEGLSSKEVLKLRLLSEELLSVAEVALEIKDAYFWIEKNEAKYEIHFMANTPIRKKGENALLKASKDKKNAAYRGMTGVIMKAADELTGAARKATIFGAEFESNADGNAVMSGFQFGGEYNRWVYSEIKKQAEFDKRMDDWDELELSVLNRLADDIIVSARKNRVEILVVFAVCT